MLQNILPSVCVCVYTQIYIFVSPPTTVLESEINNAFFGVFETAQSDGSLLYPPAPPQPTLEKKKKKREANENGKGKRPNNHQKQHQLQNLIIMITHSYSEFIRVYFASLFDQVFPAHN